MVYDTDTDPYVDPATGVLRNSLGISDTDELAKAEAEWQKRLNACPPEQQPYLVMQYANPVRNQYRIKAGLAL